VALVTPDRHVLVDNRSVLIRHLRFTDREMYRDAVAGLSPRSRYLRFAAPLPRLSESQLDQMMDFDGTRHVVYAALTPGENNIVGVARFVSVPDPLRSAEVAIAVADDWQGAGLGFALLARLVERARQIGLRRLIAITLSENRVAGRLARSAGFSLTRIAGIYTEYELPLADPAG
jgi:acetyltransferase